jgi:hypothetical protein
VSPEFALWSGSQHARLACQKCHHTTPEQSLGMLNAWMRGAQPRTMKLPGQGSGTSTGSGVAAGEDSKHAQVEIGACASCHLSHDKEWVTQVGASRGHRVHATEQKIPCVHCHGQDVHGSAPPSGSCQECHGERILGLKGMQQLHCLACHDFLSVEVSLRPSRRDCLRCHQAKGIHPSRFPDDGPMRFTCGGCHKPHAPPGQDLTSCASCHKTLAESGLHAQKDHQACSKCHRPHSWRSEKDDCTTACHKGMGSHHPEGPTCQSCHSFRVAAAAPPRRPGGN